MQSDINSLNTQVNYIINQIGGTNGILLRLDEIDTALRSKISSSNVLQIRETNGSLEYTTDGSTWVPVSTAGIVQWGDIVGNIINQPDLQLILNNMSDSVQAVSDKVDDLEDELDIALADIDTKISDAVTPVNNRITTHLNNNNNPHSVTKEQLGVYLISKNAYDALPSKSDNNIYFVDDTFYNA